jgi:hypothetical protein
MHYKNLIMAAELEKLARELAAQGHPVGAQMIKDSSRSWLKAGFIPKKLESNAFGQEEKAAVAEPNLEEEWQRYGSKFVELGFHTELGMAKLEYLDGLPKFEPQPEEYAGRFDLPLIVETRIPWLRQAELAGIGVSRYFKSKIDQLRPLENNNSTTGDATYAGWFNRWDQRFTQKITPLDAKRQLKADEVSAGLFEGIALQIVYPEFVKSGKCFDLIGYPLELERIPFLGYWNDGSGLGVRWGGNVLKNHRPLVRGSKIVTRPRLTGI